MRRKSWQRKVQTPSSGVGPASRRSRNRGTSAAARRGGRPVWGRFWRAARPRLVVAADPGLNGAVRASQGPGDRGGGVALLGQHDDLMTQPDPFLREGFGQSLKFFEAVMVLDKHRSSSWCDSDAQSILPNRHNPWNRSARIFRTWYYTLVSTCPPSTAVFSSKGSESGIIGSESRRIATWGCKACN